MNLLLINSIGVNKWGGGEKWMVLAASHLIKKGHRVFIGCRKNSVLEQRAKASQVPVFQLSIHTDFSVKGYYQLKKVVRAQQIDAIIACQNKDVRVAGFLSKCIKGPVVLSRQGVQLLGPARKYKWSFRPFCHGIITNTFSIKQAYDSFGWWDENFVKVIYNGIDAPLASKEKFDLSAYIPPGEKQPFIVVSSGRLARQKGFEYLIEAAQNVVKKQPNTYFFIAGSGRLHAFLQQKINDAGLKKHVFLLGFQQDVKPLLNVADLFVLPSLYEGMPNALMEALVNGVPAVSTRVNGVAELMHDGTHGHIIEPANAPAIAKAILQLRADDQLKRLGANARDHMLKHFSVEKMVNNLESHLRNCIT